MRLLPRLQQEDLDRFGPDAEATQSKATASDEADESDDEDASGAGESKSDGDVGDDPQSPHLVPATTARTSGSSMKNNNDSSGKSSGAKKRPGRTRGRKKRKKRRGSRAAADADRGTRDSHISVEVDWERVTRRLSPERPSPPKDDAEPPPSPAAPSTPRPLFQRHPTALLTPPLQPQPSLREFETPTAADLPTADLSIQDTVQRKTLMSPLATIERPDVDTHDDLDDAELLLLRPNETEDTWKWDEATLTLSGSKGGLTSMTPPDWVSGISLLPSSTPASPSLVSLGTILTPCSSCHSACLRHRFSSLSSGGRVPQRVPRRPQRELQPDRGAGSGIDGVAGVPGAAGRQPQPPAPSVRHRPDAAVHPAPPGPEPQPLGALARSGPLRRSGDPECRTQLDPPRRRLRATRQATPLGPGRQLAQHCRRRAPAVLQPAAGRAAAARQPSRRHGGVQAGHQESPAAAAAPGPAGPPASRCAGGIGSSPTGAQAQRQRAARARRSTQPLASGAGGTESRVATKIEGATIDADVLAATAQDEAAGDASAPATSASSKRFRGSARGLRPPLTP
eukprot:scaffold596_cov236-Pinguiococcus_pyrenoidosus.AAC.19